MAWQTVALITITVGKTFYVSEGGKVSAEATCRMLTLDGTTPGHHCFSFVVQLYLLIHC